MINKYYFIKKLEEYKDKLNIATINKEDDSFTTKNGITLSIDKLFEYYKRDTGQAFTSIYYCHGLLLNLLRCDECGTVIFAYDDYENYDENLKCPTCTDYDTSYEYYTKEDIESNKSLKDAIETYEELQRKDDERRLREKKRGKLDSEITKHVIHTKKHKIYFSLGCDNISKSYFKGLRYMIRIYIRDNDYIYKYKKSIIIPLSWSYFYMSILKKKMLSRYKK